MSQATPTRRGHRTNPSQPARPGWYPDPDPDQKGQFRWWDGAAWTDWLSDQEYAPMPRGVRRRVEPKPGLSEPRGLSGFAVGFTALVIALALTALSLFGLQHPRETSGNEPAPTAFGTPAPALKKWQVRNHWVTIKEVVDAEMPRTAQSLPTKGYVTGLFAKVAHWQFPISPNVGCYLVIADLDPIMVNPDAADTGRGMIRAIRQRYKHPERITITDEVVEPHPTISGAVQVKARFHWNENLEGADQEDLLMAIVPYQSPAGDGQAMWFASLPSTATPEQRQAVEEAYQQLRRK